MESEELDAIADECRRQGLGGAAAGMRMYQGDSGLSLDVVVEELAHAGFPARETLMGATEYSISAFGAATEGDRRGTIVQLMVHYGYPQAEIDAAIPELEKALYHLRNNVFGCEL
jgi:hypothetical protein